MGLTGDDDFHFKVSADGSTWRDAIKINRSSGAVSFPNTPAPAFAASKSANQTGVAGATPTQITFDVEDYDTIAAFASDAWTPPAGLVMITAVWFATGTFSAGTSIQQVMIYKNGSQIVANRGSAISSQATASVVFIDKANGTDVYTAYVYSTTSSGTATLLAAKPCDSVYRDVAQPVGRQCPVRSLIAACRAALSFFIRSSEPRASGCALFASRRYAAPTSLTDASFGTSKISDH